MYKAVGLNILAGMLLAAAPLFASPLSTTARTVIPKELQQLIVVDYRSINDSSTAMALKAKVLPQPLKNFEDKLRSAGISPENDIDQLVFASYRDKDGLRVVGVAQGSFSLQQVMKRLKKEKIKPAVYRKMALYPIASGLYMSLVDPSTMLFGDKTAVQTALDVRDGESASVNDNQQVLDMMSSVQDGMVWSVLDQEGTQTMLKSALGNAASLADYEMVRKRMLGSRYTMNFSDGVDFDLDVMTSDSFTAATLSSLLKAGVMFRKATANDAEKTALENLSVDSSSSDLKLNFRTDDKKFQALLDSELFKTVSR
jgi:hypothetical protein